ncbi:hypothetical protein SJAV_24550 [Sulfurisphaera javensis]|uniref:Uncharacterized protein n=1 Tax=Sulfurisphaera javensis TaxID=2049879 RepID=A0AAT9GUM2_9CREN
MSVKDQKIDKSKESEKLAEIAKLIFKAEEIHEEYDEIATTDLEKLYTVNGINDTEKGKAKYTYFQLYDYFAELYSRFILSTMANYSTRTQESEIEYINILLEDGSFIILEGEEDRVVIPHPKALASTHTHPNICLFSHKDLETADQLFIKDYIAVGVLTTKCLLLLYRRGVYTLEDREILLKLVKNIKKSKTAEEVIKSYNETKFAQLSFRLVQFA